jgi:hypothetical protein
MRDFWKQWVGVALFLFCILGFEGPVQAETPSPAGAAGLRVAAVGDTGIGERTFHPGFLAVEQAIQDKRPDVLLHVGDFVYQPELMPETCPKRYLDEIREKLVDPFSFRIFVPGDNDLPPHSNKPKASGCWSGIAAMKTPLNPPAVPGAGADEGTRVIGPVLFAVIDSYPYRDPTPWLASKIERARARGLWVILALHEPAVTTAWFLDKRAGALRDLNALKPDLVLSGNQHSYERFLPMNVPGPHGELRVRPSGGSTYQQGDGVIHVVTGGGGAKFKPFADMQGKSKRTAPPEVFQALKTRALMNHFVLLEITREKLLATTYRVCAGEAAEKQSNPRWRPQMRVWKNIALECDGNAAGVTVFDRFEIRSGRAEDGEDKLKSPAGG